MPYSVCITICEVCGGLFEFNPKRAPAVYFERNSKGEPDPHWTVLCRSCVLKLKRWAKKQNGPEYEAMSRYRIEPQAYEAETTE